GKVRAEARSPHNAQGEDVSAPHRERLPHGRRTPVERGLHVCAGDRDGAAVGELDFEIARGDLERGRALRVTDQQLGRAKAPHVYRASPVPPEVEVVLPTL